MNSIVITGRLTKDVELKETSEGKKYARFCVAVERPKNAGVDFFNCTAFDSQAEFLSKYCGKGRKVLIDGYGRIDQYTKDGKPQSAFCITARSVEPCDSKPKAGEVKAEKGDNGFMEVPADDEELPFEF